MRVAGSPATCSSGPTTNGRGAEADGIRLQPINQETRSWGQSQGRPADIHRKPGPKTDGTLLSFIMAATTLEGDVLHMPPTPPSSSSPGPAITNLKRDAVGCTGRERRCEQASPASPGGDFPAAPSALQAPGKGFFHCSHAATSRPAGWSPSAHLTPRSPVATELSKWRSTWQERAQHKEMARSLVDSTTVVLHDLEDSRGAAGVSDPRWGMTAMIARGVTKLYPRDVGAPMLAPASL